MQSFSIVAVFLAIASLANALTLETGEDKSDFFMFEAWRNQHSKLYPHGDETLKRFNIFRKNLQKIKNHNEEYKAGKRSYYEGMNQFGDMTPEEFKAYVQLSGEFKPRSAEREAAALSFEEISAGVEVKDSVDWVDEGCVSEVKNQGNCGSCWSFASSGAIEGAVAIKTGDLHSLSEQQMIDCSTANNGCHGGVMDYAFKYVIAAGGLTTEKSYPYQMAQGTCHQKDHQPVATISSYRDVARMDEQSLRAAVSQGPVAVAIEADQHIFQFYKGGVITEDSCGTRLDHGVLVVGYGTDSSGQKFWKIKNSWGSTWGELGYVRISRDVSDPRGQCGVAMQPVYPIA